MENFKVGEIVLYKNRTLVKVVDMYKTLNPDMIATVDVCNINNNIPASRCNLSKISVIHLNLQKKWYDMIDNGVKLTEYRDLSDYWQKRLDKYCNNKDYAPLYVVFKNGYARDARTMAFAVSSVEIGYGEPKWGAKPNKEYYCINLEHRQNSLTL